MEAQMAAMRARMDAVGGSPSAEDMGSMRGQMRRYALHELPVGPVPRAFPLSTSDLALHDAEAHFGNGMLTGSLRRV